MSKRFLQKLGGVVDAVVLDAVAGRMREIELRTFLVAPLEASHYPKTAGLHIKSGESHRGP